MTCILDTVYFLLDGRQLECAWYSKACCKSVQGGQRVHGKQVACKASSACVEGGQWCVGGGAVCVHGGKGQHVETAFSMLHYRNLSLQLHRLS